MIDLLVCIRCHTQPTEVIDTLDSVLWSCDSTTTKVVCAVDGNVALAARLKRELGERTVFLSTVRWGWGVGLVSLMFESIRFFEEACPFNHFLSIDYDVLFIGKGADHDLLAMIDSPDIGLLGRYKQVDASWATVFFREKERIQRELDLVPISYMPGEAVQGGAMLLTRRMIDLMKEKRMFTPPYSVPRQVTSLSDDHLLPLYCRMCRLQIRHTGKVINCAWRRQKDPRKYPRDTPTKIFHIDCSKQGYVELRKYFWKVRGTERRKAV